MGYSYTPDFVVPPGETLTEVLEELNMSQADLARRIGLTTKHVNQIVSGRVRISTEVALRLERATGVPARIWSNLESRYQEQDARIEEERALEDDLELLDRMPVDWMVRAGLLTKRLGPVDRLREILSFFGVANPQAWSDMWDSNFASMRTSAKHESSPEAVAVWLRLGELEASEIRCEPWNRSRFREALQRIRSLTRNREPEVWHAQLVDMCASSGVAVAVVSEVKGARAHGAARWLSPRKALIQLSVRYSWSDIFWFSFFHEAKHILDQSKRSIYIEGSHHAQDDGEESRADRFAANTLIPLSEIAQLSRLRSLDDVERFATSIDIHPGIVVGRLQHESLWPRDRGNGLRQRLSIEPT